MEMSVVDTEYDHIDLDTIITGNSPRQTLIIGDTHGHLDRLEALLLQEGILDRVENEDGFIELKRVDFDSQVIHIGDLGQFDRESRTDDFDCYYHAIKERWIDKILWGNHDRAVVDPAIHAFAGFSSPQFSTKPELYHLVKYGEAEGIITFAVAVDGYLITHAGLHPYFDQFFPDSLEETVEILNNPPTPDAEGHEFWIRMSGVQGNPHPHWSAVNAVSRYRGGWSRYGGILWRDANNEKLSDKWPQIFGHTADRQGVVRSFNNDQSYCIDIGGKYEKRLAGIWIPQKKIVRVDL